MNLLSERTRGATRFGIVLSGGQSRRMGRDKALLEYQGKTLLEHACEKVETACGPNGLVFISGTAPRDLPAGLSRRQECFVRDELAELGPLGGIRSVLHELERRRGGLPLLGSEFLVHPVDMPRTPVKSLSRLLELLPKEETAACFEGHFLPLAFRLGGRGLEFLEKITAHSAPRERAIHSFANFVGLQSVSLDGDPADFRNFNTPEDFDTCVRK